jgi:uncharacterized protein
MFDLVHVLLASISGAIVGFILGLVGGGGSILAVPLLLYVVGEPNPHVAVGTSAIAVSLNALAGLVHHARGDTVKWRCAAVYALPGVVGAAMGSVAGKAMDGRKLLFLFALVMVLVGCMMLQRRQGTSVLNAQCGRDNAPKVMGYGLGTGLFSGFFGIGGGFLIVPGLVAATAMPMIEAIGTSLVAVIAFGLTTSVSYAWSGLVDWNLAILFVAGGVIGSSIGTRIARGVCRTGRINAIFASVIFAVAGYILWRSTAA